MRNDRDQPGDCYVRITGGQLRDWHRDRVVPASLVFVDISAENEDFQALRASMRAIPAGALVSATWVLVRMPDELRVLDDLVDVANVGSLDGAEATAEALSVLAADLEERLADQGLSPTPNVGLVRFPVGASPVVGWSKSAEATDAQTEELLHRGRRAELRALIDAEEAVSTPATYHYRLPSGHHSASFVRVGDVFRHVRAAYVLSTWLRSALDVNASNFVVIDTGTIAPIASELDVAVRNSDAGRIQVLSLDEYPESSFEFRRAFAPLSRPAGSQPPNVLCLLSVESTGGMRARARAALDETAGPDAWRLEPLISRRANEATAVPLTKSSGNHEPWLALADLEGHSVSDAQNCRLCEDPDRARLVSINPRNFSAKSLPEPELLMPVVGDGHQNRTLWNRYEDVQPDRRSSLPPSISYLGRTRDHETDKQSTAGTYFEPSVLAVDDLGAVIEARLTELRSGLRSLTSASKHARERASIAADAERLNNVDLVVVDRDDIDAYRRLLASTSTAGSESPDADMASDEAIRERLASSLAVINTNRREPNVVIVDGAGDDRAERLAEVARDERSPHDPEILLFTFGLRLGVTLQRLLVDVHNAWRVLGRNPVVNGLVVHAHPEDERAWAAVRNAFYRGNRSTLVALWLTYFPHRSPIDDERALLQSARASATGDIRTDIDKRLALLELPGPAAGTVRPFWSGDEPRLRRTSYYGDELHDRTALSAVGAAMQRARLINRPQNSPYWYRFDMPKIFRSYFDGLIHVAALRWLRPREGWWGSTVQEQQLLIAEAKHSAPTDWPLVLPELLLASAQGKVALRI